MQYLALHFVYPFLIGVVYGCYKEYKKYKAT
jgi:hypothetical protein